jgi:hypothetical protein
MSLDISNFYLMAPMTRYEYVRMNLSDFPDDIIEEYNLRGEACDIGTVIAECRRAVHGLPQAGILANKYLEKRLNDYGYYQSDFTNGLWMHKTRPIQFALCVDDFGVKYINDDNVEHLKGALTGCSRSLLIWKENDFVDYLWTGITRNGRCIVPYQVLWRQR